MLYGYFGLGFLASLSLIVLNDKDHFGMTEVTQDKTFELKAVVQAKMAQHVIVPTVGRWFRKVYLYNTPDKKKLQKQERKTSQTQFKRCSKSTLVQNDEMVLSRVLGQNTIWPC